MLRVVVLLAVALGCLPASAALFGPNSVTVAVRYPSDGGPLKLVFTNQFVEPVTVSGMQELRVTRLNGVQAVAYPNLDARLPGQVDILSEITLQAKETRELDFLPEHSYALEPDTPYWIDAAWTLSNPRADHTERLALRMPYVVPAASPTPTFTTPWVATLNDVQCRMAVTLFPAEQRGVVMVEYRNNGTTPVTLHTFQLVQANVHTQANGATVTVLPAETVELTPPALVPVSLPAGATIGLPTATYNPDKIKRQPGEIVLWLGTAQYLLQPGVTYTVDATVSEPGGDWLGPRKTPFQFQLVTPERKMAVKD